MINDANMNSSDQLRMTVYAALLAALTAAGAYIAIPVGPVPIVLQNLFIFLSGLLLGRKWGVISLSVYLLAGLCGLPVFAGGTGGIGRFAGPTGGYLIGFLPAVYIIGMISEHAPKKSSYSLLTRFRIQIGFDIMAMICGTLIIYGFGVTWLKIITGMTLAKTLAVGMYPFLIGDIVKIIAAIPITKVLRPLIRRSSHFLK